MADPTIQTFCCHQPDKADSSVDIMQAFNSNSYSAVCLISSSIGILGAVYQVCNFNLRSLCHQLGKR